MSKGGETSSTTTPWNQEALEGIQRWAQEQSQVALQYGGNRVAGQSGATIAGQNAGFGLIQGAGQGQNFEYLNQLLSGQFLNPDTNPNLRGLADQGARDITRQYKQAVYPGASLSGFGRTGSGAEANLQGQAMRGLGDALGRNYNNIYGQNYQMERDRMQQGLGLYQGALAGQRGQLAMGMQLGGSADQYQQRLRDDQTNRFQFGQNEENNRLGLYNNIVTGMAGFGGTTTQSGQGFGVAQGVGAGIGALGLLASFFPPTAPLGMAVTAGTTALKAGESYGAWQYGSSRDVKTHIDEIEPQRVAEALERLTINIWKYLPEIAEKNNDHGAHIGPYAEDFKQLFAVGDGRTLHFIDMLGVSLAATKGAMERIKELEERLVKLEGFEDKEWPNAQGE